MPGSTDKDQHLTRELPILEVLIKSSELAQLQGTQMRLALHPPRLLIRPELDVNLKIEDFSRVDEAVEAGYRAARAALERFESG